MHVHSSVALPLGLRRPRWWTQLDHIRIKGPLHQAASIVLTRPWRFPLALAAPGGGHDSITSGEGSPASYSPNRFDHVHSVMAANRIPSAAPGGGHEPITSGSRVPASYNPNRFDHVMALSRDFSPKWWTRLDHLRITSSAPGTSKHYRQFNNARTVHCGSLPLA